MSELKKYLPYPVDTSAKEFSLPLPDKPIIMNQYSFPACVGFSCAMAKMISEYMLTNKWVELSPYSIYGYYSNDGNGMGLKYGIEVLEEFGALPKAEFGATGDNPKLNREFKKYLKEHPEGYASAARFKIEHKIKLNGPDEIAQALASGMPVVLAVKTDNSFGNRKNGIEPTYPSKSTGSHALAISGWKEINGKRYFVALNSWGTRNGDEGKVYLPENRRFSEVYAICDKVTPLVSKCKEISFIIGKNTYFADGVEKQFDSVPYIKHSRSYLPVRFVAENLGASVEWDGLTSTATLRSEEATISLTVGQRDIKINESIFRMDVAPEIVSDRMMCPIRAVAEALNCSVDWVGIENKAIIRAL